jgi:hypothetical protein
MHENQSGHMPTRGFQQIQSPTGIYIEVVEWATRSKIMTGLRGSVEN